MKVFIWGCYWQGNFGDDLMAVIMSKYFLERGYEVKVFRLPKSLADQHGIGVCSDVADGVAWADAVVLGGGAFLQRQFSLFLKMLSPAIRDIYKELENLYVALRDSNKKFAFCSIGSSGARAFEDLDRVVRDILSLSSNKGGSVRLVKDLALFEQAKPKCEVRFYPDILLASYLYIGGVRREDGLGGRIRVGVNVSRRDRSFVKAILEWRERNFDKVDLDFVLTHSIESGISSEYISTRKGVGSVVHLDPCEFAHGLLEFDCIVSIKLHLGLVALAGGANFISYKGQPKTIDQLTDLGLASCVFPRDDVRGVLCALDMLLPASKEVSKSQLDKITSAKKEAVNHLVFVEELLFHRL